MMSGVSDLGEAWSEQKFPKAGGFWLSQPEQWRRVWRKATGRRLEQSRLMRFATRQAKSYSYKTDLCKFFPLNKCEPWSQVIRL